MEIRNDWNHKMTPSQTKRWEIAQKWKAEVIDVSITRGGFLRIDYKDFVTTSKYPFRSVVYSRRGRIVERIQAKKYDTENDIFEECIVARYINGKREAFEVKNTQLTSLD